MFLQVAVSASVKPKTTRLNITVSFFFVDSFDLLVYMNNYNVNN